MITNMDYVMLEFYDSGYYVGHSIESYNALINLALDTKDKIWFYILTNKRKTLSDHINKFL